MSDACTNRISPVLIIICVFIVSNFSISGLFVLDHENPIYSTKKFIYTQFSILMTPLLKCCFCLDSVLNPVVMCGDSHIGCFDCVCTYVSNTGTLCAMCRQPHSFRFDRLISEISHQHKKRKRTSGRYEIFVQLLELKEKKKYKPFTRSLQAFACATKTDEDVNQMTTDISNIKHARVSAKRLKENRVYNAALYAHLSI